MKLSRAGAGTRNEEESGGLESHTKTWQTQDPAGWVVGGRGPGRSPGVPALGRGVLGVGIIGGEDGK